MTSSHDDTRLLYSIPNITAYHLQDGTETPLCPSGPQTLSVLVVPTSAEEVHDLCLHLSLPPELELPLPASTHIFHQQPNSYLIPLWGIYGDSADHGFTRIELGKGVSQEDIDTFETILAQFTAFMEREPIPNSAKKGPQSHELPAYNPSDYKPGQGYVTGTGRGETGHLVLIDEDNGSVVGEVAEHDAIVDDSAIKPGEKDPVEIYISPDGKKIEVKPVSEDYLALARHPAYQSSSLVQNAAAASRLLVTTSDYIANLLTSGAEGINTRTKPQKPLNFSPAAHARVRKINKMTEGAATLSSKTVGSATKIAQNVGAALARRTKTQKTKAEKLDAKGESYNPGLLNKSMIAFSTLADGLATSGKHLLTTGGTAATAVVGHVYGDDARAIASELTRSVTNVGLVYIDVTGVSRRAVIKSVAKGMVVGRVAGGGNVVVGAGDGGDLPEAVYQDVEKTGGLPKTSGGASSSSHIAGLGGSEDHAPPAYSQGEFKPSGQGEKFS
jgi:spartin